MKRLTYKDFKIGQTVTCFKIDNVDFYDQHLTIGKNYKIYDLDFHIPYKLCIFSDNERIHIFMPIEFFVDMKYFRKLKLENLENANK